MFIIHVCLYACTCSSVYDMVSCLQSPSNQSFNRQFTSFRMSVGDHRVAVAWWWKGGQRQTNQLIGKHLTMYLVLSPLSLSLSLSSKIEVSSATLTYDIENLSKHQFEITSDRRVVSLQASSQDAMLYWLTTLQQKRRKFSAKRKKTLVDNVPEQVSLWRRIFTLPWSCSRHTVWWEIFAGAK